MLTQLMQLLTCAQEMDFPGPAPFFSVSASTTNVLRDSCGGTCGAKSHSSIHSWEHSFILFYLMVPSFTWECSLRRLITSSSPSLRWRVRASRRVRGVCQDRLCSPCRSWIFWSTSFSCSVCSLSAQVGHTHADKHVHTLHDTLVKNGWAFCKTVKRFNCWHVEALKGLNRSRKNSEIK